MYKKYNIKKLDYKIITNIKSAHKLPAFDIKLIFDGKYPYELFGNKLGLSFNLMDFKKSINKNKGRYFIFSCGCGSPECAGWINGIKIKKSKLKIHWFINEKHYKGDEIYEVIFNKKNYENLHEKLYNELIELAEKKPKLIYNRGEGGKELINYLNNIYGNREKMKQLKKKIGLIKKTNWDGTLYEITHKKKIPKSKNNFSIKIKNKILIKILKFFGIKK